MSAVIDLKPLKLELPDVTIVAVDTICHDLTRMAIEDSAEQIKFGDAIVFTDDGRSAPPFAATVPCAVRNLQETMEFIWYEVPKFVHTSHFLIVQWDGWVLDPEMWDWRWLNYDYVGAPWWYKDEMNVGNGGFSLRSTRLMMHAAARLPCKHPEDVTICRTYGPELRDAGFRFAPQKSAESFSWECTEPRRTFGFHALRNWPFVLTADQIEARRKHFNAYVARDEQLGLMAHNAAIITSSGRKCGFVNQKETVR